MEGLGALEIEEMDAMQVRKTTRREMRIQRKHIGMRKQVLPHNRSYPQWVFMLSNNTWTKYAHAILQPKILKGCISIGTFSCRYINTDISIHTSNASIVLTTMKVRPQKKVGRKNQDLIKHATLKQSLIAPISIFVLNRNHSFSVSANRWGHITPVSWFTINSCWFHGQSDW